MSTQQSIPEGAVWQFGNSGVFYRAISADKAQAWLPGDKRWVDSTTPPQWFESAAALATGITRLAHADDGWRALPELPPGPGAIYVRYADGTESMWGYGWAWNWSNNDKNSDAYRIVAWRPCEQAPAKTVEQDDGVTYPPVVKRVRRKTPDELASITPSDRAGIDKFTPPPERTAPVIATPRLMLRTRWGWL